MLRRGADDASPRGRRPALPSDFGDATCPLRPLLDTKASNQLRSRLMVRLLFVVALILFAAAEMQPATAGEVPLQGLSVETAAIFDLPEAADDVEEEEADEDEADEEKGEEADEEKD